MTTDTALHTSTATRPRRRRRPYSRLSWLLCLLGAVLAFVAVFPLVWMVIGSFKTAEEVNSPALIPQTFTLENYVYVFSEVPFARYLFNSFFVSAVVTVVSLWFHSMAAYALARLDFPGRERIFLAIFSTMLVSAPVTIIPTFIIVRTLGMVDNYAGLIVPHCSTRSASSCYGSSTSPCLMSSRRLHWSTVRPIGGSTGGSSCRYPARSSRRLPCSSSSRTGTPSSGR